MNEYGSGDILSAVKNRKIKSGSTEPELNLMYRECAE